jgi:hypothetical protein
MVLPRAGGNDSSFNSVSEPTLKNLRPVLSCAVAPRLFAALIPIAPACAWSPSNLPRYSATTCACTLSGYGAAIHRAKALFSSGRYEEWRFAIHVCTFLQFIEVSAYIVESLDNVCIKLNKIDFSKCFAAGLILLSRTSDLFWCP